MIQEYLGGYDYQFLPPGPIDDQKCPICHLVVRNAYQVNCCGKILCEGCLMRHIRSSRMCPMCREYIGYKYFKDTKSDREIKCLKVLCSFRSAGCEWNGKVRDIEEHLEHCLYQDIECEKCERTVLKLSLEHHMTVECPMRKHKCHHCNEEGTHQFIVTSHKLVCPEVQVKCQNIGCKRRLKRSKMSSHMETCPKQIVRCPFNHIGCEFSSRRENLLPHIEGQISSHLCMVTEQVKSQSFNRLMPVVLKFSGFSNALDLRKTWYSDGFYTGTGGYKLQLFVYPFGNEEKETLPHHPHLSAFICLMSGLNDDSVEWPLKGKFTITLLNQLEDRNHHTMIVNFNDKTPESIAHRQKHEISEEGWGRTNFILHSRLGFDESCKTQYLKDDVLYFKVDGDVYSRAKPWLAVQ